MKIHKILALVLALGSLAALSAACSTKCGPANCSGCCDSKNNCVKTPANDTAATCGTAGNACVTCASGQVCNSGVCGADAGVACNPPCVVGCCGGDGRCYNGTSTALCGNLGGACSACASTQSCANLGNGTGGSCQTAGPDGGPAGGVGFPCATNADCQTYLGSKGVCLLATSDGGATYPGGYCTLLNCGQGNGTAGSCPGNSKCWAMGGIGTMGNPPLDFYGEGRTMCLAGCTSDWDCNCPGPGWQANGSCPNYVPDYVCLFGNRLNSTNTDFGAEGFGCFVNKPARPGQTGTACNPGATDNASVYKCGLPPTNGGCYSAFLRDGGFYPYGECQSSCLGSSIDTSHSQDYWCGDGGICLTVAVRSDGLPLDATCYDKCYAPDGGQSNCAPGLVCVGGITYGDGGPANFGTCGVPCSYFNFCPSTQFCTAAGYCQTGSCSASTCPNGCCSGGVCFVNSAASCGTGGGSCSACGSGQICSSGACLTPDSGTSTDGGNGSDGGNVSDGGNGGSDGGGTDGGPAPDSGSVSDSGSTSDAGCADGGDGGC